MNSKRRKRVRILGKILFVLYIGFIIYFLLFSDLYGRTGQLDTYHYNLELFKEIKRFWNYRDRVRSVSLCLWPANTEASFLRYFTASG